LLLYIVDDSRILCEHLIGMLADLEDIEVIGQAQDPLEAIESIQKLNPQVVILDIRMPRGSGLDVLEAVKKNKDSPKVIIFTNYPYPQYRKKCMQSGADYFFDKHTEFEKLFEILKQLAYSHSQKEVSKITRNDR